MNQIFLGRRSYGFGSAARAYFGKGLDELSIAEMAMLAGVPQNPSRHNPAVNPQPRQAAPGSGAARACATSDYITRRSTRQAMAEPMRMSPRARNSPPMPSTWPNWCARRCTRSSRKRRTRAASSVITTIRKAEQDAAYESVRRNVTGLRPAPRLPRPGSVHRTAADPAEREEAINEALQARPSSDGLVPAVVTEASPKRVSVENVDGDMIDISGAGLRFAAAAPGRQGEAVAQAASRARWSASPATAARSSWSIVQVPQVAAAFVAHRRRHRRLPRAGRRLRLQPAEVQPRHPGLAPARLRDQALHLFGGAGTRLLAGHPDPRRAARHAGRERRRDLVAAERRRQVRRPGHDALSRWRTPRTCRRCA